MNNFDRISRATVAGTVAGLAGGAAKLVGELIFPPRSPGEPIPPVEAWNFLMRKFTGNPVQPQNELLASQLFHWPFSVGAAVVYCCVAEFYPRVTFAKGIGFGLVLLACTHETALPWLGLSLPWSEIPLKEHLSELSTHCLFGFVVEVVRSKVRSNSAPQFDRV